MKHCLLIIMCVTSFNIVCYCQTDTSKIYYTNSLKRGFYKTYNDYINNSPALNYDFTVEYNYLGKSDSIIVSADYTLTADSLRTGTVWGFCDGQNVFIRKSAGLLGSKFWRVEYIGKMPYFNYSEKNFGFGMGLIRLVTVAVESFSPSQFEIMVRDEKDKNYLVNKRTMRKLLSGYKDLLDEFNKQIDTIENARNINAIDNKEFLLFKEYLNKLNDRIR